MTKPLCVELFCGMFGWGEGFVSEGYRVVGFDIEHLPHHGSVPSGCSLALQDVLTLHGSQFKDAAIIVASPPCQAYSYRAMPWKRAKALPPPSNELFDACFRIQREACEAAGRYIPLVVENVKGAQPWVGRAKCHYGSFYLWGDVPALMPLGTAIKNSKGGSWFGINNFGNVQERNDPRDVRRVGDGQYGVKQRGSGAVWFDIGIAACSSRSSARKAASAAIAKIPFELASHIARVYKPDGA